VVTIKQGRLSVVVLATGIVRSPIVVALMLGLGVAATGLILP